MSDIDELRDAFHRVCVIAINWIDLGIPDDDAINERGIVNDIRLGLGMRPLGDPPWSHIVDAWPKMEDGRFICTMALPRPADAGGRWSHRDTVDAGTCSAGCCDRVECAACGATWTDRHDGDHA